MGAKTRRTIHEEVAHGVPFGRRASSSRAKVCSNSARCITGRSPPSISQTSFAGRHSSRASSSTLIPSASRRERISFGVMQRTDDGVDSARADGDADVVERLDGAEADRHVLCPELRGHCGAPSCVGAGAPPRYRSRSWSLAARCSADPVAQTVPLASTTARSATATRLATLLVDRPT